MPDAWERVAVLEVEVRSLKEQMQREGEQNRHEAERLRTEVSAMKLSIDALITDARAGSKISTWIKNGAAITAILAAYSSLIAWLVGSTK